MKIICVRCLDNSNAINAYRILKKIGVNGSMRLSTVKDLMQEYCNPWKKPRGSLSHRPVFDKKKMLELQKAFGLRLGGDDFYFGPNTDELMNFFRGLESVLPGKVSTCFTGGLDQITIK